MTRMNIQNGKCKQCKLNVTEATDEEKYYHIEDLRKSTNGEDVQSCDYVCAIKTLFQDLDKIPIAFYSSDTVQPHKTSKRVPNRPLRAKPKNKPDKSLSLSSIRKHQLDDGGISPILKWKEDSNFPKPAKYSISSLGFESKFLYSRWELLTVNEGVLCIKWMENSGERLWIIIPQKLRNVVMWNFYDAVTAEYLGVRSTIDKLNRSNYYWPHLRRYVQD